MKKKLLLIVTSILLLTSCTYFSYTNNTKKYDKYVNSVKGCALYMPTLEELGDFKQLAITKKTVDFFFLTESVAVFVKYTEENFETQKAIINQKYHFLEEPTSTLYQVSCTVKGYDFRVVDKMPNPSEDVDENDIYNNFPKMMLSIGISDKKIAYLFHYDFDLDFIDDYAGFLKRYYYFR